MIDNIQDAKEQLIEFFGDRKDYREATEGQKDDAITELADSNVDIYNSDLLEWVKNNYNYVEEAIDEFGTAKDGEGRADFIKQIQQGQYLANRELLDQAREELDKND